MAMLSSPKARRLRKHQGETTHQVIVFQIQGEWFALPIVAVKKVVPKSEAQGDYHHSGAGLTVYEGKELLVLDIAYQVFGTSGSSTTDGYLLIIRNREGDLVGLPVASSPTVRRFAQSEIVPLPSHYIARVNIQCVSGLIVQADNQPILFLLNPDQLLYTQPLLPPAV